MTPRPARAHPRQRPTTILLARHGQSVYNAEKRLSGQLDVSLSPKGIRQAHLLAQILRRDRLAAIYTSRLIRAVETARPTAMAHGLPIQQCDALKELHLGVLQGRFRDARDLEAQRLWHARQQDKLHYRVPEGETFADLERRVLPCLNALLTCEAGNVVLIVGHRNTNRIILGALLHWPQDVALGVDMKSGELYEILTGEEPRFMTRSVGEPLEAHRLGDHL